MLTRLKNAEILFEKIITRVRHFNIGRPVTVIRVSKGPSGFLIQNHGVALIQVRVHQQYTVMK